jgi:hypothetical protein
MLCYDAGLNIFFTLMYCLARRSNETKFRAINDISKTVFNYTKTRSDGAWKVWQADAIVISTEMTLKVWTHVRAGSGCYQSRTAP